MGVSKFIYLGPYLEYTPKTKEVKYTIRVCGNELCTLNKFPKANVHTTAKFCPECGHIPVEKSMTKTKTINIDDILDDHNQFYEPHAGGMEIPENLLLPNSKKDRPFHIDLNDENLLGSIPFPAADIITADQHWFLQFYGETIKKLNEAGVQTQIKYGFVIHYS